MIWTPREITNLQLYGMQASLAAKPDTNTDQEKDG